jgi:membrane protease YdiL (CAAX protease family)
MTTPDLLYLSLIAILLLLDYFVLWPAFLRWSEVNPGRARLWLWSGWMVMLWSLVAVGVALWLFEARAWESLRLVVPHGWRLWGAGGLVLILVITYGRTVVKIARSKRQTRIKMGNPHVEKLAPHTRSELGCWVATSVSAGFCEEFIFRGYLIWVFQPVLGLWGAAAFSVVVFAVAHAYQGVNGILATGLAGSLLTLVVLISGSLWPAIALHVLTDIGTGLVAWLALRRVRGADQMSTRFN